MAAMLYTMAMTSKQPIISVLICNYNYGRYIEEALDSVMSQSYKVIETIIIDDGSKDDSVKLIQKYIKSHPGQSIKLVAKKKNEGICYARNEALVLANGEYVLFLDSDDKIPTDYIQNLYGTLVAEKADVAYGDLKSFGDEKELTNFPDYSQSELLMHNYINISSLVRKNKIVGHKFDVNLNRKTLEDYDFWMGLSLKGLKFTKAKGVYLNYRVQKDSRNINTNGFTERILNFIEVWKYCIEKYQQLYPGKIPADTVFKQLRYQIQQMGAIHGELNELNKVVHDEFIPELNKRDQHIQHLEIEISKKHEEIQKLLHSREYIVGSKIIKFLRKVKNIFKFKI